MKRPLRLLIILALLPLLPACSLFTPTPIFEADGAAEQLARLSSLNNDVKTFKGTGSLVIQEKGQSQRFRIAWAGAAPNRLRMEILAAATPVESLAYDGRYLQLRSHMERHAPFSRKVKNPSLKKATGIPLTLPEIHALLSGKFYVGEYESARLITPHQGPSALILRPDRSRTRTITLDQDHCPTRATLTKGGEPVYDLRLTRKPTAGGINRYQSIVLTSEKGVTATIRIDRMIVNPPVDNGIFTLDQ